MSFRTLPLLPMLLSVFVLSVAFDLTLPDSTHCSAAAHFLRDQQRMTTIIDADTIDDWRSRTRVPACRITAAGGSDIGIQGEAIRLYDRLRAAKWVRTPDPRDSPNEGSLRFRWEMSDCLFNINREALLGTESESRVNEQLVLKTGETRYQVFVMCLPVLPAAPRVDGVASPAAAHVAP